MSPGSAPAVAPAAEASPLRSAFISYARAESASLARALQLALERFAKPWYRLRSLHVFRDDSSMSANADLRGTIEAALGRSDWFILLAGPQAAASPWVEREIAWWLANRRVDRLMLVHVAGELRWLSAEQRFWTGPGSAIPPILERAYPVEPRWVDLRWFLDDPAAGTADPRFQERVADLAAPVHGSDRADLVGENVRQHRSALRLARIAVVVLAGLLVLSLVATFLALRLNGEARRQRDAAVQQNLVSVARQLAATAENQTDTDLQLASLTAVQAHRLHPDVQTGAALYHAAAASPHLVEFLDAGAPVTATAGTEDGSVVVAGTANGDVRRWDRTAGTAEVVLHLPHPVTRVLLSADGRTVAAWAAGDAADPTVGAGAGAGAVWRNGSRSTTLGEPAGLSPSGRLLAELVAGDSATTVVVRRGDAVVTQVSIDESVRFVVLSSDQRLMVAGDAGRLDSYALPSGKPDVRGTATSGAHPFTAAVDPTGEFVVVTNGAKDVEVDSVRGSAPERPRVVGHGRTETPNPVAFALSPRARLLATAVSGRIWVSPVTPGGSARSATLQTLTGAGAVAAGTLQMLSQRLLVAGSGTAVSVWDLSQDSRLGPLVHIRHSPECNGCGPGSVLMSPDGRRAVIYNESHGEVALADFGDGTSAYEDYGGGSMTGLVGTQALWLDPDHLFTWDDTAAVASVRTGGQLGQVEQRWLTPSQRRAPDAESPAGLALSRSGGQVLLVDTSGRLLRFDLAGRETDVLPPLPLQQATDVGFDDTGGRVWAVTATPDDTGYSSRVQLFDVATGKVLLDRVVDGEVSGASFVGATLRLWGRGLPLTTVDLGTGRVATLPHEMQEGSAVAAHQPFAVFETDGVVSVVDLGLGTQVASFEVPTEVYAWTELGFSDDGQFLGVATEAADDDGKPSVRLLRFGYQAWADLDCRTAGRALALAEWQSLTSLAAPDLRC